jgi:hypothetical protein
MTIFRFIIMVIILAAVGVSFAIAGMFIGGKMLGSNAAEFGALGLAIGGAGVGYLLGIMVGILLIKKFIYRKGSLLLGIFGAIIGIAITTILAGPLNLFSNSTLFIVAYLIIVTGLSIGGLYLKR